MDHPSLPKIQATTADHLLRLRRARLAEACAQLDPEEERALAEEGIARDLAEWPVY